MTEGKGSQLLRYREAAERLNVPLATLYSLVSRREIPHVRLGGRAVRFDAERLNRWIAERSVEPTPTTTDHAKPDYQR